MLSLTAAFGDDEHTATEGPYVRMLRIRKWIFLFSFVIIGVVVGMYDENAAARAFPVLNISKDAIILSASLSLFYLTIQYNSLLVQVGSTYDIILKARFESHLNAETDLLGEQLTSAMNASAEAKDALPLTKNEQEQARLELSRLKRAQKSKQLFLENGQDVDGSELDESVLHEAENDLINIYTRIQAIEDTLSKQKDVLKIVSRHNSDIERISQKLDAIRSSQPSTRPFYVKAESIIDATRLITPQIMSVIAFATLARYAIDVWFS